MAVADIPLEQIVNTRTSWEQFLWELPEGDVYRWDRNIGYMYAYGATPVEGQGLPPRPPIPVPTGPFSLGELDYLNRFYVRTINGVGPDENGNVEVAGGGGGEGVDQVARAAAAAAQGTADAAVPKASAANSRLYAKDASGAIVGVPYGVTQAASTVPVRGADGTLKVGTPLAAGDAATKEYADGKYVKPSGNIPEADLAAAVQQKLAAAVSAYQRPAGGVPAADMAEDVRTALTRAAAAVQPGDLAAYVKTVNGIGPDGYGNVTVQGGSEPTVGISLQVIDGGGQIIPKTTFTTVTMSTVVQDTSNGYDEATGEYIVQSAGLYAIDGAIRPADGSIPEGGNFAVGVDVANQDTQGVYWYTAGAFRNTFNYARMAYFTAGDRVRMFVYQETAGEVQLTNASLSMSLVIPASQAGGGGVDQTARDAAAQAKSIAEGKYSKPANGIDTPDMAQGVIDKLNAAQTAVQPAAIAAITPGGRLAAATPVISETDLNVLTDNGFYIGSSLANSPDGTNGFFYVRVTTFEAANWATQEAWTIDGYSRYYRSKTSGTWQPWSRLDADKVYADIVANTATIRDGGRLGTPAKMIEGVDLNTIAENGWYRGPNLVNAPGGSSGWHYLEVIAHDTNAWVYQRATGYTGDNAAKTFTRQRLDGTWLAWVQIADAAGAFDPTARDRANAAVRTVNGTSPDGNGNVQVSSNVTASQITDASPTGRGVLTAADPAAARSVLGLRDSGVIQPEAYGAKADGTTDDTVAIQAAADAVAAAGGGVLWFAPGKVYGLLNTVQLSSNTLLEFNGATIQKLYGGTSTSFVNKTPANTTGYGSAGGNITLQNGTIKGNFDAPGIVDGSTGWHHVDNLNFYNMRFIELQQNAHAMDLGACRNVKVVNCTFAGLKVVAGREYVESIQVDSSSYIGSSWKSWPTSSYDGLPTRGVLVQGCTFTTYTKNGTTYPMACPIGQHGAFGQDENGYYEDIRFVDNHVIGFNTPVDGTAYGWMHFRSTRGLTISGNQFEYTGPTGVTGKPTVISVLSTTQAYAFADAQNTSPTAGAVSPPLNPANISVTNNMFKGFKNAPVEAGSSLINIVGAANSIVANNTCDGLSSGFVTNPQASGGNTNVSLLVTGNNITSNSSDPVLLSVSGVVGQIKDNIITLPSGGTGIQVDSGNAMLVQGNTIYNGATGVLIRGCSNTSVQNNMGVSQTSAAYSVGPAGFGSNASDTVLSMNRTRATAAGAAGILLGSTSSRTKMQGNVLLSTVPVSDGGTSTTTPVVNTTTV